ncbi:MAG: hypothetical protein JSW26_07000 [Desulfobacterales bacterium]|nr:MAG: hypothetical protein JSW26_07000 [Desulfobacterales bacterium]
MMKFVAAIKILILTMFLSTIGLLPTGSALAQKSDQTKTFVVIGTATVQGTNVSAAREKAIADSLVTAVALMTEELLEVEAFVSQFTKLNELLFEQTSAFVRGYKVLTEAALGDRYRVIVEASVSRVKIAKLLTETGILRVQTALPSVLFLIAEQRLAEPVSGFWWGSEGSGFKSLSEAAMAEHLKEAGFVIIDHKSARNRAKIQWAAFDKPGLTDQEAAELGSQLKADVVVTGMSTVTPSTNIMGSAMRSFNGTVSVRVVKPGLPNPLLSLNRTAVAVSEDDNIGSRQALEEVGDLAGQALAEELTAAWQKQAGQPSKIAMVIRGTSHLAYYVKFRKSLNSIPGVGGIQVKEIKPNEATLLVEYKGKTQDLAAALMQQNFESFGINIFEVTQDTVRVEIIPG